MIEAVQMEIEGETGFNFDEQTFTDTFSGEDYAYGSYQLQSKHFPITDITSLTVVGSVMTENTDFYLTDAETGKINTKFILPTIDYNNIILVYKAGYLKYLKVVKALCEDWVVYSMLLGRETPPSLQSIVKSSTSSEEGYVTLKSIDKLVNMAFDIVGRFERLPKRTILGVI